MRERISFDKSLKDQPWQLVKGKSYAGRRSHDTGDQGDEGGSGGAGKKRQGEYRKEKFFRLIERGILKNAKKYFFPFIKQHRTDDYMIKSSKVTSDLPEKASKKRAERIRGSEKKIIGSLAASKSNTFHDWHSVTKGEPQGGLSAVSVWANTATHSNIMQTNNTQQQTKQNATLRWNINNESGNTKANALKSPLNNYQLNGTDKLPLASASKGGFLGAAAANPSTPPAQTPTETQGANPLPARSGMKNT
jgi:hypothetical protein